MTGTQPELGATFSCLAERGVEGSGIEVPIANVLKALSPDLNGTDMCNAGFLRRDAVLVLTILSDEDDGKRWGRGTLGDPADWYQQVVDAKGGDPGAVVALGLIGETPAAPCVTGDALEAPRLQAFFDAFGGQGLVGSICDTDYGPLFDTAVELIDGTCDDFVPPG